MNREEKSTSFSVVYVFIISHFLEILACRGQVLSSLGLCGQKSNGGKIQISYKMKGKKGFEANEGSCRTNWQLSVR